MRAIPSRPDAQIGHPELPAKRSLPSGAVIMALVGVVGMVSSALPWWRASVSLTFSNAPGGEIALGVFRGAAAPTGQIAAIAGLALLACGMGALGTTSSRLRRTLALGGAGAGLILVLAGGWSVRAGDDIVASRADRSVDAQDLGMSTTASGFASEVGREAGLSDPAVSFNGRPTVGVAFAVVAGLAGIFGSLQLRAKPGGSGVPRDLVSP